MAPPAATQLQINPNELASLGGGAHLSQRRPLDQFDRQRNELLFRQRNANIVAANNSPESTPSGIVLTGGVQEINQPSSSSTSSSRGFLDRLTSLELLFLVSSLMFLVLLALGLLGTYYCFRRRRRPSSSHQASAILSGRKRRGYLGPVGGRAARQALERAFQVPAADVGALRQHHQRQQQQQYGHPAGSYYHAHLSHPAPSSSSPESDLSQQVLLPAGGQPIMRPTFGDTQKHYHSSQHVQPVVGRRDGALYGYAQPNIGGHLATLGRKSQQQQHQQHYLQPAELSRHLQRHQPATLGRASAREPLLKLAPQLVRELPAEAAHRQVEFSADPLQHARHHQAALSRARSLQQLQADSSQPNGRHLDGWQSLSRRHQHQQQQVRLVPVQARRSSSSARPRQMPKVPGPALARPKPLEFQRDHRLNTWADEQRTSASSSSSSSSDNEIELNNNDSNHLAANKQPRLYLKSIEDSFITNVTEIHEQEYEKRDSRMALSWAQWRARQPVDQQTGGRHHDDDPYPSNQANLRSLTELDVNFAKLIHLKQLDGDDDDDEDDKTSSGGAKRPPPEGQLSEGQRTAPGGVPIGGLEKDKAAVPGATGTVAAAAAATATTDNKTEAKSPASPDLVISADYELGRLKLAGSPSSQGSVSYV